MLRLALGPIHASETREQQANVAVFKRWRGRHGFRALP